MGLRVEHRQHKGPNNRAENSHQPTRRRERIMKRFKSSWQAERFLSVHDQIANLFHIPYPKSVTANFRRASRKRAFAIWREISAIGAAASSHLPNKSPIFRSVLTKVDDAVAASLPFAPEIVGPALRHFAALKPRENNPIGSTRLSTRRSRNSQVLRNAGSLRFTLESIKGLWSLWLKTTARASFGER